MVFEAPCQARAVRSLSRPVENWLARRPSRSIGGLKQGISLARIVPFALLVLAVVVVPLRMLDEQGLPRYRALEAELREVRAKNEKIARDVADLERDVRALRTDPAAIEHIARDELGMVRRNEFLFQFPE